MYNLEGNDRNYGVIFSSLQNCYRRAAPKVPKCETLNEKLTEVRGRFFHCVCNFYKSSY